MEPQVLYEDQSIILVSKPAGMVVNRADTTRNIQTLQDWIDKKYRVSDQVIEQSDRYIIDGYNKLDEFKDRSGIVHRLDKETSGIIIVARNPDTFIDLQKQFKSGKVKKTYKALVHGKVQPSEGEIEGKIGRLPWNRTRFGILEEGREAKTIYKVLDKYNNGNEEVSLVEIYPQTGRTHQIRVHFQHIKHPVFGDELYAGRKQAREDRKVLPRHFLHASEIRFFHPKTGEPMVISSPLPPELEGLINAFKSR